MVHVLIESTLAVASAADSAFSAELHRVHGKKAGDCRYQAAHDTPELKTLRAAYHKASEAYNYAWHVSRGEIPRRAFLVIQCCDTYGNRGVFLADRGDNTTGWHAVSPIYASCFDAFPALRALGWIQLPYDFARPCGVYENEHIRESI